MEKESVYLEVMIYILQIEMDRIKKKHYYYQKQQRLKNKYYYWKVS